jgi:YHS domain-containing protein
MTGDPVCGLRLNDAQSTQGLIDEAAYKSEYEGQTDYFCSRRCKQQFDQDPERHSRGSWLGGADLEKIMRRLIQIGLSPSVRNENDRRRAKDPRTSVASHV